MTLIAFFKFFGDVMDLIKGFKSTPQEKHEEIRRRIEEAFKLAKDGDPSSVADIINK